MKVGTAALHQVASSSRSAVGASPQIAPLARSVLEVSGPDAQRFLRGLACKDVDALRGGYSGFINASGRVLHTNFIFTPSKDTYLITHASNHPVPLQRFMTPFRLRSKVRIKDVSEQWDAFAAWGGESGAGPSGSWRLGSGGAAERVWAWEGGVRDWGLAEQETGCWDLRAGWTGARQVLVPKGKRPSLTSDHDEVASSAYDLRRMLLGVPEGPGEIVPGQALPLESCMDLHGGVDFRKGCYLGQELTVRTYHTGATRKRILPLRFFPLDDLNQPLPSPSSTPSSRAPGPQGLGDITYIPSASSPSQKPRAAGRILATHDSVQSVGLGLVRLEMAERCWWSGTSGTIGEWLDSGKGRLVANTEGKDWGVYVDKGEAYSAALAEMARTEQEA